ncbi:ROK family protein [bacterium AH-315-I18]|nr:ROK family protein [Phycisphaeraceae bacterium]MBN4060960.1 ROK family protein [bacterium AH-315-I18]
MQDTFKRVNQQTAAVNNRQLVIRLLQEHGELSRSQLVGFTGLRGSTLTYITRELLQMNMLKKAGQRVSSTVGQKQQLLQINAEYGWVLGIDVRVGKSQGVIMDAAGNLVGDCLIPTTNDLTQLKTILPALIDQCCLDHDLQKKRLLGVGLGISGIVDMASGVIIKSDQFQVLQMPLAAILSDLLGVPVRLDHDANLIALAEQEQGNARGLRDFIVLSMDDQVRDGAVGFRSFGSALVLNGKVHRGSQFAAGELDSRIIPQIKTFGVLSDLDLLAQKDGALSDWLRDVALTVGASLGCLVNLLDPQAILLAGDRLIANQAYVDLVASTVNDLRIGDTLTPLQVFTCAFASQSCARGAALSTRDMTLAHAVEIHVN